MTVVAATKYVSVEDMAALAEAGIEVVGENRAQDLEAKHARYGDAFRWHFIGHLQSRKAKTVNEICELVPLALSESAAQTAEIPALVEVNLAGEETKSGVARSASERFLALYEDVRGLMTMPPPPTTPRRRARTSAACASWPSSYGLRELSMGTSQDYRVAADEGATMVRVGSVLLRGVNIRAIMGFGDLWNRTLVYFGIAEEDDDWDEDGYLTEEDLERTYSERPNVRRLTPRGRQQDFDDWTDPEPRGVGAAHRGDAASRRQPPAAGVEAPCAPCRRCRCTSSSRAASTTPSRSRTSSRTAIPVILNLQGADQELSKRLIDFTSGLTYALDGGMQRVADKVFLLTPRNVEVSAEERARLLERGFFNQA